MKVLITGGTGFIGGAVAKRLLAKGDSVVILARSASKAQPLARLGASVAIGDVRQPETLERAVRACELVVHSAGLPRQSTWRAYRAVHIGGTRNMVEAARGAGVRRFVHIASHAVMFSGVDLPDMQESHPYPLRYIDPYCQTKSEGERLALGMHGTGGMEVTSIRPDVVWGRGDTTVLPIMAKLSRSPLGIPMCSDGSNIEATSHIENLVDGIVLAMVAPSAGGRAYLIGDSFRVSFKEFLGRQVEAAGIRSRFTRVPLSIAAPAAWLLDKTAGALGLPVPLARFGVWSSVTSRVLTTTRARDELGYVPRVGFEAGLADLAAWVKEIGGPGVLLRSTGKGVAVKPPVPVQD